MQLKKDPSLWQAIVPIAVLVLLLGINVTVFNTDATNGPNQIAMLIAAGVAGLFSFRLGHSWEDIEVKIVKNISSAMGAILILMAIGSLSGTWLLSGTVPAMIYYGLKILNPTIFLFAACIISCIVSIATGSSWSTVATVGIALLGIGNALGMPEPVVAGAIISGAYFGDKVSPLSDTTNLAPAMAGTDLFTHIKYMMYTTVPTIVITLLIFFIWGLSITSTSSITETESVLHAIDSAFNINLLLFIPPIIVIGMIVKKIPALPALLVGALLGGIFAVIFQPQVVHQIAGINSGVVEKSFVAVMKAMAIDISIHTDNEMISKLLSSRGMYGMMNTIWLIICAMTFGGAMESCGMLRVIADRIIKFAHSTGSLVASTACTCIFFNFTASDQYMAITVPGRMYAETFRKRGYKPELLSRTLEDSGTVTSVLIPWNTCGATQSKILGVSTMTYAPYSFFCIISPIMTVLQAYLNLKIRKFSDDKPE